MANEYMTPPKHVGFLAKKLLDGEFIMTDCAVAHLQPNGGGPVDKHTHAHDHFFIVTEGEVEILEGEKTVVLKKDEAHLVNGETPHSVWNRTNGETVMVGITLKRK